MEVQDALQQEKTENTRLKMYLDQILKVHLVFPVTFLVFQASLNHADVYDRVLMAVKE